MLQDEAGRIAALRRLDVLDSPPEEPFEKIVNLVRTVLRVPIATVTLVDSERQWFMACRGIGVDQTPRAGSFCTHTIQQSEPLVVPDADLDSRFSRSPLVVGTPYIRSYAGVPLRTPDGYNVGSLCAMDSKPHAFSEADVAILVNFASIVSDELELRLIARRDYLTGALTRRGFIEQAGKEIAQFACHGVPSALAMLDIDHFKAVNDTYGHAAGDQVLRQVAELCGTALRSTDALGRIGGEEFALLFPGVNTKEAMAVAEQLRLMIEGHAFDIGNGRKLRITASFGVASPDRDQKAVANWLATADSQLYLAKRQGRNRCSAMLAQVLAA